MQWLSQISVRRPVFATVLILVICVLGFAGYSGLGVDRFPKVDFPTVMVVTRLPGSAPEEIETEVTDKIEEAVNTISGIDELRSTSTEGVSQVIVTFVLEKDIDVASQEVREKVNTILGELPADTEAPMIMKFDADSTPVLYIAVNADKPIGEVTEVADKVVRRRIESTSGVGQVSVLGGTKRQVNVWLDAERMRALGITAVDVERAISSSNLTVPGGRVEAGPIKVLRVQGRVSSPQEIAELPVRDLDGHKITVGDLARVEDGAETAETAAVKNGETAVVLSIRKQSGTNSVAMVDGVRERLAEIEPTLPQGYSLEVIRDNTATIRSSVHAVQEHLILGALFAGAVVLIFLGSVRSTLIAALAIPVSIIGTFALMQMQGFSLDTITLLALALAVGIVIDDAIVVLENIHRFIEEKGLSPIKASVLATKEIALAVLATTLSLVAVFLPVAFMSGIVGRFLKSFGMTMAFSILVSMLVSFTLTPMLSSRWLKHARPIAASGEAPKKPVLERIVDKLYLPVERLYVKILAWVMRHRWVVVVASVATLASAVPLLGIVPKGFLPKSDDGQFEINIRAPEGTSLDATTVVAERIAREARKLPHVTNTITTIGDNNDKTPNLAKVFVQLEDPAARELTQDEIMTFARRDIVPQQPKDLRIDVSDVPMFSGGGTFAEIQYEISGPDLDALERYSTQLVERVRQIPGAVDVNSTHITGKPELNLRVDRAKASDLGVRVADIANTLQLFVGGSEVSSYEEDGQTYQVFVRGVPEHRADLDGLSLLTVPSSKLGTVPLLDVVRSEDGSGPASVTRLNRRRQVMFTANLADGAAQSEVMAAVEREIEALNLPPEYKAAAVGQSKEMKKTVAAFGLAFLLSFVFMYLVLAAQMESWLHPVTILLALPLTLPFALVSLLLFKQQLDIYSMLGLLVLFGVVKKNSILQIDHTNHLRKMGKDRLEAILEANRDRLRPILMTTIAFVAGMLPLAFSTGIGAGFNQATAGVIVGGQILSLLLTLLATPVAYSLLDDLSLWIKRRFGDKARQAEVEKELAEVETAVATGTVSLLPSSVA